MWSIDINIDLNIETNFQNKFAINVSKQFEDLLGINVSYDIIGDEVIFFLEKKDEEKRKIPYKIVNGRIVVPKEFQKFLSSDGKSLRINQASDFNEAINKIDLNIFK